MLVLYYTGTLEEQIKTDRVNKHKKISGPNTLVVILYQ